MGKEAKVKDPLKGLKEQDQKLMETPFFSRLVNETRAGLVGKEEEWQEEEKERGEQEFMSRPVSYWKDGLEKLAKRENNLAELNPDGNRFQNFIAGPFALT